MSSIEFRNRPRGRTGLKAVRLPAVLSSLAAILLVAALVAWLLVRRAAGPAADPMAGYITDVSVLEHEYAAAGGTVLTSDETRQLFQRAADLARQGQWIAASELLETASKTAAVPVVFNDLGVLYEDMGDRSRMVNAFREALARSANYQPVLRNLARQRDITVAEARPVTHEVEPNSTNTTANVIAIESQVDGEIAAGQNDIDTFKFPAPPAPRDTLALDIAARSPNLRLGWNIYDDGVREIARGTELPKPGDPVHFTFAPPPNATLYVSVWGMDQTAGPYRLSLKALKAFDAYEPNDDIFHASPIPAAGAIQANIMDGKDQDFYSFLADRSGTIDIDLENDTSTFVPGMTVFGPDQRTIGFAPDAKGRGASLHYSVAVEAGQKYYVQVWPVLDHSAGDYKLRLEPR